MFYVSKKEASRFAGYYYRTGHKFQNVVILLMYSMKQIYDSLNYAKVYLKLILRAGYTGNARAI